MNPHSSAQLTQWYLASCHCLMWQISMIENPLPPEEAMQILNGHIKVCRIGSGPESSAACDVLLLPSLPSQSTSTAGHCQS